MSMSALHLIYHLVYSPGVGPKDPALAIGLKDKAVLSILCFDCDKFLQAVNYNGRANHASNCSYN